MKLFYKTVNFNFLIEEIGYFKNVKNSTTSCSEFFNFKYHTKNIKNVPDLFELFIVKTLFKNVTTLINSGYLLIA